MDNKKIIKVKQVGSPIRRNKKQFMYLRSLGLRKIGQERELECNRIVLGLINKVQHIVEVDQDVKVK